MSSPPHFRTSPRLVHGSILANFSHLELSTADEKTYSLTMTPFTRFAMRIIGVPHLGFRMRAKIILSEALQQSREGRVLDAGCGYGLYAMSLGEMGYRVDAIDVDNRRIETLKRMVSEYPVLRNSLTLQRGSLTSLPFDSSSYDTIICSEVIEHIKDDEQALNELVRVLKPSGTLILSVPYDSTYNQQTYRRFDHQRPGYTEKSLKTVGEQRGLVIEKVFCYERFFGGMLFNAFNFLHSKPLMGICFYPFYALYLLDYYFGFGEPNQIVVTMRKK